MASFEEFADPHHHPVDGVVDLDGHFIEGRCHGTVRGVNELHDVDRNAASPVGYGACRIEACGEWELSIVLARTGGVCTACSLAGLGAAFRRIEIVSRGRRTTVTKTSAAKRSHRPGRKPGATKKTAQVAARRALKRLKNLFPDLYDILYAEERAAAGLEPWSVQRAVEHHDDPDGSVAVGFAEMLHELDKVGVQ